MAIKGRPGQLVFGTHQFTPRIEQREDHPCNIRRFPEILLPDLIPPLSPIVIARPGTPSVGTSWNRPYARLDDRTLHQVRPKIYERTGKSTDSEESISHEERLGDYRAFSYTKAELTASGLDKIKFKGQTPAQVAEIKVYEQNGSVAVEIVTKADHAFDHSMRVDFCIRIFDSKKYEQGIDSGFSRNAKRDYLKSDPTPNKTKSTLVPDVTIPTLRTRIFLSKEEFDLMQSIEVYLPAMPYKEIVEELKTEFKTATETRCCEVIEELASLKINEAVIAIKDCLTSINEVIRECAAKSLREFAGRSFVLEALKGTALSDKSPIVRIAAIHSISNGDRFEARRILQKVASDDKDEQVRIIALDLI